MECKLVKTKVTFAPQGDFISLSNFGYHSVFGVHERGEVVGFSKKSRSRLMSKIAKVNKNWMPVFVTLTYPDNFPGQFEVYKRDLDNFFRSFFRQFPKAGVIWKLEYQSRGAAHYHLLVWGVNVADLLEFVPSTWHRIAASDDPLHLQWHLGLLGNGNQHCVQAVRSWHGVKSYASKYFSKIEGQETYHGGRVWGVRGNVPFSKIIEFTIDMKTALAFRRAFRRWSGYKNRRFGFWANGYSPAWLEFIFRKMEEVENEHIPPNFPPGWWLNMCPLEDEVF